LEVSPQTLCHWTVLVRGLVRCHVRLRLEQASSVLEQA
jgi:hypothetical protein